SLPSLSNLLFSSDLLTANSTFPPFLPYRPPGLEARRNRPIVADKSTRGDFSIRRSPPTGLPYDNASAGIRREMGYEGGGMVGAARLSVLSRVYALFVLPAYERLREPEDRPRGAGAGAAGGFATLSDLRGAQRRLRLEIEGFPSPMVLGNGRETRSAGLPPRQQGCAHMGDSLLSGAHRAL
ncbi:hypothetical protein B0H14DRAFT_2834625, partial [Mycena olivaceomarginata]